MSELEEIYARYAISPEDEAALFSVCVHEAAHDLTSSVFKLPSATHVVSPNCGVCVHRDGGAFANATIGIAGVMGEALLNVPRKGRPLPSVKLALETIYEWGLELKLHLLSPQDRDSINQYPNIYDAARAAFEILSKNLDTLEVLAKSLFNRSRDNFIRAKNRNRQLNEAELENFIHEWSQGQREKAVEKNSQEAIRRGDELLASLPPCPIPPVFNYETFLQNTGASKDDVENFLKCRVRLECADVGRAASDNEFQIANKFFREHQVTTRGMWIASAKEFCAWREQNKNERKVNL